MRTAIMAPAVHGPTGKRALARRAAEWMGLAAAPTFAAMALLSTVLEVGGSATICGPAHGPSWLVGMVPMYLLMSAFHLAPWLKRFSR